MQGAQSGLVQKNISTAQGGASGAAAMTSAWPTTAYRAPVVANSLVQRNIASVVQRPPLDDSLGKAAARGYAPGTSGAVPSTISHPASAPSTTSGSMEGAPPMRRQAGRLLMAGQNGQEMAGAPGAQSFLMPEAVGLGTSLTYTADAGESVDGRSDAPWSLCSTTLTLQPGSSSADRAVASALLQPGSGSADVLTSRVDEALMRLTLLVDNAMTELRTELPRARQQIERQQVELERLREEQLRSAANCQARIEALEHSLSNETGMRGEREKVQKQAMELMEKNLTEEMEARCELEKALGKSTQELREHVALEVEGTREMAMREMRERMDGQRVLREEAQLQQQALMGLTSRIDDALIELRTEVPNLRQETIVQKAELEKVGFAQASGVARIDVLEKSLAEEARRCREAERAISVDLRDSIGADVLESQKQMDAQLRLLKDSSADQGNLFSSKLAEIEVSTRDLTESKVRECEASLQSWVETTTVNRVVELDRTMRKEMTERAGAIKDVLDKTAHNAERWSQLQAKFDELLIEVL